MIIVHVHLIVVAHVQMTETDVIDVLLFLEIETIHQGIETSDTETMIGIDEQVEIDEDPVRHIIEEIVEIDIHDQLEEIIKETEIV